MKTTPKKAAPKMPPAKKTAPKMPGMPAMPMPKKSGGKRPMPFGKPKKVADLDKDGM